MIQEKDFLYRVPVKTAPITTPGGQIRNPEILVDVEGGEFMHGNILDANSTNKLINQSVKDAVDNKLIESGYVTKDLLEAETTRATAKENEIKAQVDIINGDSTTEGSFRKAIADVVAAAPEDLDTLKEIADKLAGNDDLHTALNQAITEKADTSALLNEVTRATGAESGLQAAIATKADATALSNYVLTTALNQQVDTLNTAISAKQDAGNYLVYNTYDEENGYHFNNKFFTLNDGQLAVFDGTELKTTITGIGVQINSISDNQDVAINEDGFFISSDSDDTNLCSLTSEGIKFAGKTSTDIPTANGGFISLSDLANKEDISNLSAGLSAKQNKITVNSVDVTDIETADAEKLRTIVTDLTNALSESGLIRLVENVE